MEVHVDRDAFLQGLQMVHNVVEPAADPADPGQRAARERGGYRCG